VFGRLQAVLPCGQYRFQIVGPENGRIQPEAGELLAANEAMLIGPQE
jgi:hypothetical protein